MEVLEVDPNSCREGTCTKLQYRSPLIVPLNDALKRSEVLSSTYLPMKKRKRVGTIGIENGKHPFPDANSSLVLQARAPPHKRVRPHHIEDLLNISHDKCKKKTQAPIPFSAVKQLSRSPTQISAMDMIMDRGHQGNDSKFHYDTIDSVPIPLSAKLCFTTSKPLHKPNFQGRYTDRCVLNFNTASFCRVRWPQADGLCFGESLNIFCLFDATKTSQPTTLTQIVELRERCAYLFEKKRKDSTYRALEILQEGTTPTHDADRIIAR